MTSRGTFFCSVGSIYHQKLLNVIVEDNSSEEVDYFPSCSIDIKERSRNELTLVIT